ncbi:sensor domain-containing protein [Mycobacterium colombiense]|uniref:sensor domain-containing protein n=1 Tax=Mycobacterium colombiense TaxID=339268 RepID=UPI0014036996|nr:sensor domain-containing protein [Mycobacterium colombiense]
MLATLSVVFAFVFAPAGLILGHLGLAQIRQTGQRGRDRALVGVTLSYVFITALVVALIVAAIMPDSNPTRLAIPMTTTTTKPPPPTVAPADMDGLLPTLDDFKHFTGDDALTIRATKHLPTPDPLRGPTDRPDCWGVFEYGAPEAYDVGTIVGYSESVFSDIHDPLNQWSLGGAAAAFHDSAAAAAQVAKLQSIWRKCGGSTSHDTESDGRTTEVDIKPPSDTGNGITTIETVSHFPIPDYGVRAIAAKTNVVIDVGAWSTASADRSRQVALAISNFILNKIPG